MSRGGTRGGSPRAKALEGIRAKLARQTFDWMSSPAEIFHRERFENHGVSFSDRANVLVGVTTLELALEEAIRTHFVTMTPDENAALFSAEKDAPLSNLGSKIKIGYALGIYQRLFLEDLKTIQLVRNYFAHSVEYVDFSDPVLTSAVSVLNFPRYGFDEGSHVIFPATRSAKGAFIETVKWTMMQLVLGTPNAEGARRISDRVFYPCFPWQPEPSPDTAE